MRIRFGGAAIIMDPFPTDIGLKLPPQQAQADVLTISSGESSGSAIDAITGPRVTFDGPGEYEAAGMHLRGIRTAARTPEGEAQRWNTMFVGEAEGLVFCHLGNPDKLLTNREIDDLGSPHLLMVPVGSDTGISAADAVEIVNTIEPKVVLPVLYAHGGNKAQLRDLKPFLTELGVREPEAQARLTVNRTNLPDETQVVILQPVATLL